MSLPIWNFVLPTYAYWKFDDFSWGDTRKTAGETTKKAGIEYEGEFDSSKITMRRWNDFEAGKMHKRPGSFPMMQSTDTMAQNEGSRRPAGRTRARRRGVGRRKGSSSSINKILRGTMATDFLRHGTEPGEVDKKRPYLCDCSAFAGRGVYRFHSLSLHHLMAKRVVVLGRRLLCIDDLSSHMQVYRHPLYSVSAHVGAHVHSRNSYSFLRSFPWIFLRFHKSYSAR